jgi:iron complex transport system ATP-binding protein
VTGAGLEASRIRVEADGKLLIDGVDCTVRPGSLAALIGPNGAGKSTLLRALAVVSRPDAGAVLFDDADLVGMPRRERARIAALVEQDTATELSLTVESVVALGRVPWESLWSPAGHEATAIVADALAAVDMTEFAGRDFATLSGGERQRVMLAKAIAQQPSLLLLDEPTNHLDINAQLAALVLLGRLAADGATVLAALHDLTLAAAFCDHVIVLSAGSVVASGPVAETLTPELIREVYDVEAVMLEHPVTGRPVIAFSPLTPPAE